MNSPSSLPGAPPPATYFRSIHSGTACDRPLASPLPGAYSSSLLPLTLLPFRFLAVQPLRLEGHDAISTNAMKALHAASARIRRFHLSWQERLEIAKGIVSLDVTFHPAKFP